MITGPLLLSCPFPEPDLIWRETGFTVTTTGGSCTGSDALGPLTVQLPPELTAAVPKRQAEFLAGRLCAGLALRQAGLPVAVGRRGRAPVWPAGAVGSISHCGDHQAGRAIAVVSTRHLRLGLDCEPVMPDARAADLGPALISTEELALRPDDLSHAAFTTLGFSAKEALYKALSPGLTRIPGFLEARVSAITPATVTIHFDGQHHDLHWRIADGLCLTLAAER